MVKVYHGEILSLEKILGKGKESESGDVRLSF
jgi:hypothetical protein